MRGEPIKITRGNESIVKREMYFRKHEVIIDSKTCKGCGTCINVCPEDAISLKPAVIEDGRLKKNALAIIDEKKCAFCGVCSEVCYFNAITFKIDGTVSRNVLGDDFPKFIRKVDWNDVLCDPICNLCEMSCPTKAIDLGEDKDNRYELITIDLPEDAPKKLIDRFNDALNKGYDECVRLAEEYPSVKVNKLDKYRRSFYFDENKCIACGWCQGVCPNGAIVKQGIYVGTVSIKNELCTEDCRVCMDVCPCKAIYGSPVRVNSSYCMICGACKEACPQDAITITREKIFAGLGHSGTWIRAIDKLTNGESYTKELYVRGLNKMVGSIRSMFQDDKKEEIKQCIKNTEKMEGGI
ncbi:MAG TPA: 4Fe-4S binding protein [Halobacteria archaeon]|jgi:4Fe-4S ferredoxin|nr:4Fe-4S binding protein [Halobacteria archaeon]